MSEYDDTIPASAVPALTPATAGPERYVLLDPIGVGGMGKVWKAYDRVLDRNVALKVLHDEFLGAAHQERLAAEARAMARLTHPNVVAVYDVGEREGRAYITMELVKGQDLSRWLKQPRTWREIVAVFRAAGEGLEAAHRAGILHRDIKPGNILVGEDGRVRVTDFGVAGETPTYRAPERAEGKDADARSDQYSFCRSLDEALRPIKEVPAWLGRVVARGLSPDPAARFGSMGELVGALERRRRRLGGAAAVLAVAIAVPATWLATRSTADSRPRCGGGQARMDGVWNDAQRARGRAAFDATGASYAAPTWQHVEETVDRYAGDWVRLWEEACRAVHVEHRVDAAAYAPQESCFDRRREAVRDLTMYFDRVDAPFVERAMNISRMLPALAPCADPASAAKESAAAPAGEALAELQVGRERLVLGRHDDARAAVDRALEVARAAGDRRTEAEALILRGDIELAAGDAAGADATLADAALAAEAAGASDLQVDAWTRRGTAWVRLDRLDAAGQLFDQSAGVLQQQGDFVREADVARGRAELYLRRDHPTDAIGELNRTRKLLVSAYGPRDPHLGGIDSEIAAAKLAIGWLDEADRDSALALEEAEKFGAHHPNTARIRRVRAAVLRALGRDAEAAQHEAQATADLATAQQ